MLPALATRTRRFKDGIYERVARLGKAVAAQASVSIANASRQFQVLRGARLVDARKHGLYVEHRIADEEVGRFLLLLRQLAGSRLAEIEGATRAFFESSGTLEGVRCDSRNGNRARGRARVRPTHAWPPHDDEIGRAADALIRAWRAVTA